MLKPYLFVTLLTSFYLLVHCRPPSDATSEKPPLGEAISDTKMPPEGNPVSTALPIRLRLHKRDVGGQDDEQGHDEDIISSTTEVTETTDSVEDIERKIDEAEQDRSALVGERDASLDKIDELKRNKTQLEAAKETSDDKIREAQHALAELQQKEKFIDSAEIEEKLNDISIALEEANKTFLQSTHRLGELIVHHDFSKEISTVLLEAQNEAKSNEATLQEKQVERDSWLEKQSDYAELLDSISNSRKELNSAEKEANETDVKVAAVKKSIAEKETEMVDMENRLKDYDDQLELLRNELDKGRDREAKEKERQEQITQANENAPQGQMAEASKEGKPTNTTWFVWAIVGCVVVVAIVGGGTFWFQRRNKKLDAEAAKEAERKKKNQGCRRIVDSSVSQSSRMTSTSKRSCSVRKPPKKKIAVLPKKESQLSTKETMSPVLTPPVTSPSTRKDPMTDSTKKIDRSKEATDL